MFLCAGMIGRRPAKPYIPLLVASGTDHVMVTSQWSRGGSVTDVIAQRRRVLRYRDNMGFCYVECVFYYKNVNLCFKLSASFEFHGF